MCIRDSINAEYGGVLPSRPSPQASIMADVSESALSETYQEIRKDASETNWVVLGYEGNNKIVVQGKGSDGLEGLKALLEDDQAQYAYLRVTSGDQESRRTKFVLISWCGESVGALKRAKMSVHKASVKQVFKEYALEFHATKKEELEEEDLLTKVRKAGGADYSGNTGGN
eukprot:TRINITY_DN4232_c0_g1_i1.p2 TRINITY_DN4232_c0_g1~~TRINITY_DN4232_c0_g1_i1.p2  ORF type:complete len:171 (-),score=41.11 TRINITY_DN4232_c0_g1_i1:887-1399(-)